MKRHLHAYLIGTNKTTFIIPNRKKILRNEKMYTRYLMFQTRTCCMLCLFVADIHMLHINSLKRLSYKEMFRYFGQLKKCLRIVIIIGDLNSYLLH